MGLVCFVKVALNRPCHNLFFLVWMTACGIPEFAFSKTFLFKVPKSSNFAHISVPIPKTAEVRWMTSEKVLNSPFLAIKKCFTFLNVLQTGALNDADKMWLIYFFFFFWMCHKARSRSKLVYRHSSGFHVNFLWMFCHLAVENVSLSTQSWCPGVIHESKEIKRFIDPQREIKYTCQTSGIIKHIGHNLFFFLKHIFHLIFHSHIWQKATMQPQWNQAR